MRGRLPSPEIVQVLSSSTSEDASPPVKPTCVLRGCFVTLQNFTV
jgi:hypothetical protein